MTKFIDIHTHNANSSSTTIVNCFPSEIEEALINQPHQLFSLGIHPWHIQPNYSKDWNLLETYIINNQVIALGECGLDKVCETPFDLQKEVFIKHIKLAEKIQKPLLIHCVKAYSELIQLKKELNPNMPWILHGYRGNKETTQQLLPYNFFFSFGKGISLLRESLEIIPLDRLFLETDDEVISIEKPYAITAQIKQIDIELLKKMVGSNFENVFY